ncbi:MAG: DUF3786 domain-containing protein [Ruminococcus sp.]|jgi:hypothetical protein
MSSNEKQNRAFQEMLKPALKRLQGRSAEKIAENTGIFYDSTRKMFHLKSLGQNIYIQYPQYNIVPQLNEWHHLLILHYMDLADKTPPTGQLMSFGELPDGMARGGGFDRQSEEILSRQLGNGEDGRIRKACEVLGAKILSSNADLCAVFYLFPFYPITLKIWYGDEEIPGSGRLFPDRSAGRFLSVEDAVTAGTLLLESLLREYKQPGKGR